MVLAKKNHFDEMRAMRYKAVCLYGLGYAVEDVERLTGCTRPSLMNWCREYRRHGVAGLVDGRVKGNRSKLTPAQIQEISCRMRQLTPREIFGERAATPAGKFWTVHDLERAVSEWYNIKWDSRTSYYSLMTSCGFQYTRTTRAFIPVHETVEMLLID